MGKTSRLPRTTLEPACDHRVNWAEMVLSWLIRDWIWVGPLVVVSVGNRKAMRWPYTPGSIRAATHAVMFGRLARTSGWMSANSGLLSPGSFMTV